MDDCLRNISSMILSVSALLNRLMQCKLVIASEIHPQSGREGMCRAQQFLLLAGACRTEALSLWCDSRCEDVMQGKR